MKYPAHTYAQAFLEVVKNITPADKPKVIKRFIRVVSKNGDASRLPFIFKTIQKSFIQSTGGRLIDIDLARPASRSTTDELTKQFTKKDFIRFSIRPALIAGVRITINDEREYDNSFARRLKKIFTA
ncbi:MAG: F0F1 ATP synthase subunit delta [Patescibacteria group bacterium]